MNQVPPGTFVVLHQDKQRYEGLYARFDAQGQGFVADSEMKFIMQKHNVPVEALAKIWNLVNP